MKVIKRTLKVLSAIFIPIVIICGIIYPYKNKYALKTSPSFTYGLVNDDFGGGHMDYKLGLKYSFYIQNIKYKGTGTYYRHSSSQAFAFLRKYFTIVYETDNPNNNRMLIDKEDYEEFDLPYPEDLDWVERIKEH